MLSQIQRILTPRGSQRQLMFPTSALQRSQLLMSQNIEVGFESKLSCWFCLLHPMCSNFNSQMFAGFLHGFVESLSVILVSEIGDKTFFIAAILAMSNNKLTVGKLKFQTLMSISYPQVFLGAISALAVMTILSALLGFVVTTFIPREYTYYTCTAIMFLFGIKVNKASVFWAYQISLADAVGGVFIKLSLSLSPTLLL